VEIGNQEEKTKNWAGNKWKEQEKLKIEKTKEEKMRILLLAAIISFPYV
jgi:hypothetical protein